MRAYKQRMTLAVRTIALSALSLLFVPACAEPPDSGTCELTEEEAIVLYREPATTSEVAGKIAAKPEIKRLDTKAQSKTRDWIRVRSGSTEGWTPANQVVCRMSPEQAQKAVGPAAAKVVDALKQRDMAALARLVHPVRGVLFSPYVDIDRKRAVALTAAQVEQAMQDKTRRRWGSEDGSGDPILTTFSEYFKRYIYDRDFAAAPEKNFNKFGERSTTLNNTWDVFPNATVVEYHIPPPSPDSLKWASLLLIFEQQDGQWFLSGVVHDQWTI